MYDNLFQLKNYYTCIQDTRYNNVDSKDTVTATNSIVGQEIHHYMGKTFIKRFISSANYIY